MLLHNLFLYQDRYFIRVNGESDTLFYFFDYDVRTEDKNMQFQHFHTFYELCVMMGPNTRHILEGKPYDMETPYGLYFTNGNYYLLCRYQGAENISHYRVDRIQSPVLLKDQPTEPLPPGLDLERYVRERVYPFPGETVRAVLRCEEDLLSDVLDRFGMETQLRDNGDGTFDATVFTGAAGLKFWALQYVTVCQVLEPLGLRREIGEILRNGWERYETMSETVTDVRTK